MDYISTADLRIDYFVLDALRASGNWMVRSDQNGTSYDGFQIAPIGEWNTCPKWGSHTKADCTSGGFFGQAPEGWGYAHRGARFTFCETRGKRIVVGGDKIKVPEMRILHVGVAAVAALAYVCPSFGGSLDLSGCDLKGFTLPQSVGGSLYLSGCDLTEVTIPPHFSIIK